MRGNLQRGLLLVRRRTHRGPRQRVRLMETAACGLCAEAFRALTRIAIERSFEIERVDIGGSPALVERYALRVPVIVLGAQELDAAGLADDAIERWLTEVGSPRA